MDIKNNFESVKFIGISEDLGKISSIDNDNFLYVSCNYCFKISFFVIDV